MHESDESGVYAGFAEVKDLVTAVTVWLWLKVYSHQMLSRIV